MSAKPTPGPWTVKQSDTALEVVADNLRICELWRRDELKTELANAYLIAAAPVLNDEMKRHLEILERIETDSELWAKLTAGTGIASLNGYRAALAKAKVPA